MPRTFRLWLLLIVLAGLGLRLLVWGWHARYGLGGDEQEYFGQALTLLREHRYVELKLMRPPLYTGFLAACIALFDSLVQRIRLIQAIIGALAALPAAWLTLELSGSRRAALIAAGLIALDFTLAAAATELLSETLFISGMLIALWLLARAAATLCEPTRRWPRAPLLCAALAGVSVGCLVLLRSVALPLLPLGALWLCLPPLHVWRRWPRCATLRMLLPACAFSLATLLTIGPWTARNAMTYGGLILVDTAGAENLWLDNDPAGREAVKAQLFALGDDRLARQRLASQRGAAAILADPQRFAVKAWGEATKFFALQYWDDMRARRAIWVPPLEVWLRLILGDGLWLAMLVAGSVGMVGQMLAEPLTRRREDAQADTLTPADEDGQGHRFIASSHLRLWACGALLWCGSIFASSLVFHVELRYRLPLYPALVPFASMALAGWMRRRAPGAPDAARCVPTRAVKRSWARQAAALLAPLLGIALTLLHRNYLAEVPALAGKHLALVHASAALGMGALPEGRAAAEDALALDGSSALALDAMARAALADGDATTALTLLNRALDAVPDHPETLMLRGAARRALGDTPGAIGDLAAETQTLDDAQRWAWRVFAGFDAPQPRVDLGGGLDLGAIQGFYAAEPGGYRWMGEAAQIRLLRPPGATKITLRMAASRGGAVVRVSTGDTAAEARVGGEWQTFTFPLPDAPAGADQPDTIVITLRCATFRPRDVDRASPDDRELGVMVDWAALDD